MSSGGSSYICIAAHTNQTPPNATYWNLVAQKGTDGAGGTNTPLASSTVSGTVKTDSNQADPLVYTKTTTDSLLSGKANSTHQHVAGDVTSGTFDLARLPVAANGISSTTQVVRADDWRLSKLVTRSTDLLLAASVTQGLGLDWTIGANEVWIAEYVVVINVSGGTAGVKGIFTLPASVTGRVVYFGNAGTITSVTTQNTSALTTASSQAFFTAAIGGKLTATARIVAGATAGTVVLSVVTGASAAGSIYAGSYVRLDRVA